MSSPRALQAELRGALVAWCLGTQKAGCNGECCPAEQPGPDKPRQQAHASSCSDRDCLGASRALAGGWSSWSSDCRLWRVVSQRSHVWRPKGPGTPQGPAGWTAGGRVLWRGMVTAPRPDAIKGLHLGIHGRAGSAAGWGPQIKHPVSCPLQLALLWLLLADSPCAC